MKNHRTRLLIMELQKPTLNRVALDVVLHESEVGRKVLLSLK